MPSSATSRNRFEKQGTGENPNTWGNRLNTTGLDLIDEALDGYESIAITGNLTLTSTNYASDQARKRMLRFTGTVPATVTIPAVSKLYLIWNDTSATLTITMGGSDTAVLAAGARQVVMCTGSGVYTETSALVATTAANSAAASAAAAAASQSTASTAATSAASSASNASTSATNAANSASAAAASAASAAASSDLPSQTGNAGKYLTTNGSAASWGDVSTLAWTLLSSASVSSGASVTQTGLASYTEVLVVFESVGHTDGGSSRSLAISPSESVGSAGTVTSAFVSGATRSGAIHVILNTKATLVVPAVVNETSVGPLVFTHASKASAVTLSWAGAASFSGGTVSFYAR